MRILPLLLRKKIKINEVKEIKEMPDLHIRLGQYCTICQYKHEDEYLVCDYCNEHKTWICLKDKYYNCGFCKRSYHTCIEYSYLLGPFRLVEEDTMHKAYESIIQVIKTGLKTQEIKQ